MGNKVDLSEFYIRFPVERINFILHGFCIILGLATLILMRGYPLIVSHWVRWYFNLSAIFYCCMFLIVYFEHIVFDNYLYKLSKRIKPRIVDESGAITYLTNKNFRIKISRLYAMNFIVSSIVYLWHYFN